MPLLWLPRIRMALLFHRIDRAAFAELPLIHLAASLLTLSRAETVGPDHALGRGRADGPTIVRPLAIVLDYGVVVVLQIRVVGVYLM